MASHHTEIRGQDMLNIGHALVLKSETKYLPMSALFI